ncbi:MAG: hypothetical protein J6W82_08220, partial [Bacteroidales bacterium]|nr:hypothetical protein [Bacteroidales bacterium]
LGDASSTYFQGCRVSCEMDLANDTRSYSGNVTTTAVGGMLVGAFEGTSGTIIFGAADAKIKVSGMVGSEPLTSANYSDYLLGDYNKGSRSADNVEFYTE